MKVLIRDIAIAVVFVGLLALVVVSIALNIQWAKNLIGRLRSLPR